MPNSSNANKAKEKLGTLMSIGGHCRFSSILRSDDWRIVDVRVAYIRKLAILGNMGPWFQPVTAQYCVLIFGDHGDLNP